MAVRIVVAEDNLLVREGIVRLLSTAPDLDVVASCDDYDGVVAAVEREDPDVVLTDIRMPPTNTDEGLRAAREIRQRHPHTGVLLLSQYVELEKAVELLDRDATGVGYLLKDRVADVEEFTRAIRRVADGGVSVDVEILEQLRD